MNLPPRFVSELASGIYDVNTNLQRMLAYIQAFGFDHSAQILTAYIGGRLINPSSDNFGIIAKGAPQSGFENDAFIIFRGTDTHAKQGADVLTDARLGMELSKTYLPVHIGFNQAFKKTAASIQNYLETHNITGKVHCVGHSLGGAVATLAADWIKHTRKQCDVKLYTFGAPRTGDGAFSLIATRRLGADNIFRVFHQTDPVPMVPIFPYMHLPFSETGYFYPSNEPLLSGQAHSMVKYSANMKGQSWDTLRGIPTEPYGIEASIENWLRSKAPVSTSDSSFWYWVNAALIYILKKISMGFILSLQTVGLAYSTIADKIAYILSTNLAGKAVGDLIFLLMKKLAKAFNKAHLFADNNKEQFTQTVMSDLLMHLNQEAINNASRALSNESNY